MPFFRRAAPLDADGETRVLTERLMAQREELRPLFDAADGIRADMLARGWSAETAEQVAKVWLLGNLGSILS